MRRELYDPYGGMYLPEPVSSPDVRAFGEYLMRSGLWTRNRRKNKIRKRN